MAAVAVKLPGGPKRPSSLFYLLWGYEENVLNLVYDVTIKKLKQVSVDTQTWIKIVCIYQTRWTVTFCSILFCSDNCMFEGVEYTDGERFEPESYKCNICTCNVSNK